MHPLLRALPLLVALAACGPVSVQQAENACFSQARLAKQPRGEVRFGANSEGRVVTGYKIEVSSDYLQGRDPSAVYDACVYQKSGQPPTRPLYDRPDWKG